MLTILFLKLLSNSPIQDINVDASKGQEISPYIYGVNSPQWAGPDFPYTIGRLGGNRMTAYNWETNASNAGNDYHNQNDGYMGESNEAGWTMRKFLELDQEHHAASIVTIPTAGYVSADKNGDGDVGKTPNYLEKRFYKSLPTKPGKYVYPPDTGDKVVYQDECVAWLEKIKSPAEPLFFMLDNEPDLWGSTHSRIWPKNPTYAQIIANNIAFAKAIKGVAPHALVFGPANYGWNGFHTFQNSPDANGRDFLDTYLDQLKDAAGTSGARLLDVLDVHWYPEAKGGGVRITEPGDQPALVAARIQAPRSLWDPSYVEDSWIEDSTQKQPIVLIPTIRKQIETHYPGTKFSISEYNFGGNKSISGAIAQADVLGIFGRYGVFAACNWGIEKQDIGEVAGFKSFINFDGKGGRFLDRELEVSGGNPAETSVYASADSKDPHHLVLVAINKTGEIRHQKIHLHGAAESKGFGYCISALSLSSPVSTAVSVEDGTVTVDQPPMSVTTIDLR